MTATTGNNLPESWANTKLPNISNIRTGKKDANHAKNNGKYRFYTCAYNFLLCDTTAFHGECLILPGNGANVGEVFYYNGDFEAYQRTYVIENIKVTPKFLYYHMLSDWKSNNADKQYGSATNYIRIGNFEQYDVNIPPLGEQERIVGKVEELFSDLDAGVAALEVVKKDIKRYRQAVLKNAFEGKLTEKWRKENNDEIEPASKLLERIVKEREKQTKGKKQKKLLKLDISDLPELPQSWEWHRIGQLGEVKLGRQRSPKNHNGPHMRPYLRVANVFENRIDISDVKEMNFTPAEFEIFALKHGDILLNEGQSLHLVGRPAMYREEIEGVCFQNTLVRFRPWHSLDNKYYLYAFLNQYHQKRYQKIAQWTTSMAHLGATRFLNVEFPLCPLEEQQQIVSEIERLFSIADQSEKIVEEALKQSQRLRQSILKRAFEGKLVPQDPNEEPAQKLLERIKKEKG